MPSRILKESICTSETINALSPEEETFFYRLLVQCDDYGLMDARPAILRARCYPLRLNAVTEEDIERWLARLVEVGLVELYTVDGKRYLHVVTWDKHQQVRAKRSRYPRPDSTCKQMISDDITCEQIPGTRKQVKSDVCICPRESESESEIESESESRIRTRTPRSSSSLPPASSSEQQLLSVLQSVAGYPFDAAKDLQFVRQLAEDFPDVDLLAEAKAWRTYKLDRPLEKKSNARSQFRNWVAKARQFQSRDAPGHTSARDDDDQSRNPIYRDLTEEALREAAEAGLLDEEDEP